MKPVTRQQKATVSVLLAAVAVLSTLVVVLRPKGAPEKVSEFGKVIQSP